LEFLGCEMIVENWLSNFQETVTLGS
jgi:hypothetical protein